jgi:hypothetical protein
VVERMSSLPAHPEVPGALAALARSSLRMVALTNSVQQVAEAQLASSGLSSYFEWPKPRPPRPARKPAGSRDTVSWHRLHMTAAQRGSAPTWITLG